MRRKTHLALYGNVGILRAYCEDCKKTSLIVDNLKQCCDTKFEGRINTKRVKRISEPEYARKIPSKNERERILIEQNYCCYYCDKRFGTETKYKGRPIEVKRHWEHVIPYVFSADNSVANFVAACSVCNHWKSSMIFNDIEEVRLYVKLKWDKEEERSDYEAMQPMSYGVRG